MQRRLTAHILSSKSLSVSRAYYDRVASEDPILLPLGKPVYPRKRNSYVGQPKSRVQKLSVFFMGITNLVSRLVSTFAR
jgi:hypothetical protein